MRKIIKSFFGCCFAFAIIFTTVVEATAAYSGSRGGASPGPEKKGPQSGVPPMLTVEAAQAVITVDGRAELRVEPTEIRIILAVTAEAETPSECKVKVGVVVSELRKQWQAIGVPEEKIVEDFIAILPRYQSDIEQRQGQNAAVEKKVGYLMQTNLHIAVNNDEEAMQVVNIAFDNNVADVIGFDYWYDQLAEFKKQARAKAVQAARAKADELFGGLFDKRPDLINVQEKTVAVYPESQYKSFANSFNDDYSSKIYSRTTSIPEIRTFRPKNTYYSGFYPEADIQSGKLPMKSEISVVSTVRLYFQSPAAAKDARQTAP